MTAKVQRLRTKTARELAAEFNVTPRTVRNHVAAERQWWLDHRHSLRAKASALKESGLTWREVGEQLGITEGAARAAGARARGRWKDAQSTQSDTVSGGVTAESTPCRQHVPIRVTSTA